MRYQPLAVCSLLLTLSGCGGGMSADGAPAQSEPPSPACVGADPATLDQAQCQVSAALATLASQNPDNAQLFFCLDQLVNGLLDAPDSVVSGLLDSLATQDPSGAQGGTQGAGASVGATPQNLQNLIAALGGDNSVQCAPYGSSNTAARASTGLSVPVVPASAEGLASLESVAVKQLQTGSLDRVDLGLALNKLAEQATSRDVARGLQLSADALINATR